LCGGLVVIGGLYSTVAEHETPNKLRCRNQLATEHGIDDDETVFLTTFDSYSFVQRINPLADINAFREALTSDEKVRLLVKTQNRTAVIHDPIQRKLWRTIDALIENDARITLVNRTLNYDVLLAFKNAADCYVSLHRAEGWGFGMIESMLLGVPVITMGYFGNLEYCNTENCCLVDSEEVYLSADDYAFVKPGQKWVEPNISDAALCFKDVYEKPDKRRIMAENAASYVRKNFGNDAISQRYGSRMRTILSSLNVSVENNTAPSPETISEAA
jgi:glycosyltransferase involved in cell wall biosynthesis